MLYVCTRRATSESVVKLRLLKCRLLPSHLCKKVRLSFPNLFHVKIYYNKGGVHEKIWFVLIGYSNKEDTQQQINTLIQQNEELKKPLEERPNLTSPDIKRNIESFF